MSIKFLPLVLLSCFIGVAVPHAVLAADATQGQPAAKFDYSKLKPQNVFATPINAPYADVAWGEPAIAWDNGEYFLIYDDFVDGAPANLMTSRDGVYWKEEGPVLYPDAAH